MKNKAPLLHLLVVPVLTILVANGLTMGVLSAFSGIMCLAGTPFRHVTLLVTVLYGAYLHFFRNRDLRNYWILAGAAFAGILWIELRPSLLVWLAGAAFVFSAMRILILRRSWSEIFGDGLAVLAGLAVWLFLYPLGFGFSVAAFLTVQIIYEMRNPAVVKLVKGSRFEESRKVADRILRNYT